MKVDVDTVKNEDTKGIFITAFAVVGVIVVVGIIIGSTNKETVRQCTYFDSYEIDQVCANKYPEETQYFCSDVSTYMRRNLPNRISSKKCWEYLTESERSEFWEWFAYGVGYAKLRRYMYR